MAMQDSALTVIRSVHRVSMIRDYSVARTNTVVVLAILGSSETPSIARNNFLVVRRNMDMVTAKNGEL